MITTSQSIDTLSEPLLRSPSDDDGKISKRRSKKRMHPKLVMFCFISAVVLERLAYYSLLGNLAIYVTTVLRWNADATLALTLLFTGLTWISCFLGGFLGDATYGRMNTIVIGLLFYFVGYLCLPFLSWVVHYDNGYSGTNPLNVVWFVAALLLISFGEGCFKSNMSPFGADQQPQSDSRNVENFFSCYYWAINLGSLLGYGPVVLLQDRKGFVFGYAVPAGLLLLALMLFSLPMRRGYVANNPTPNMVLKVYRILKEARLKRKRNTDITR